MTAYGWQVHPAGDQMEAHGVRYRVRVSPGRGWAAEDFVRQRQLDLPIEQDQAERAAP